MCEMGYGSCRDDGDAGILLKALASDVANMMDCVSCDLGQELI